ncbi:MAG: hypothetical protein C3F15_09825 [Holophagae bacterium]|nr:MAG: hypothetical protein C3F15_09825 [Holophagae bacterium]
MTSLLLILVMAQSATGTPSSVAVSPDVLAPYRPAELTIRGEGFGPDCSVLTGSPGKLVPVHSRVVSDSEIVVELAVGFGPKPPRRQLIVDCGGGGRSDPLWLTIAAGGGSPVVADSDAQPALDDGVGTGSGSGLSEHPRIIRLDPGAIAAGEPFTLTVVGEAFQEGAEVAVLANIHAGTSREPEYQPVDFPAEVASDTVLIVDFDRGFAPSPRLRSITVVNPDGGRSPPMYLEVTGRLP